MTRNAHWTQRPCPSRRLLSFIHTFVQTTAVLSNLGQESKGKERGRKGQEMGGTGQMFHERDQGLRWGTAGRTF